MVDRETDLLAEIGGAGEGGEFNVEVGGRVLGSSECFVEGDSGGVVAFVFAAFVGGSAGDDAGEGSFSGEAEGGGSSVVIPLAVEDAVDAEFDEVCSEGLCEGGIFERCVGLFDHDWHADERSSHGASLSRG